MQLTSSRTWIDNNNNFIPDCDLTRNTQTRVPTQTGADNQIDTCAAAVGANANFYNNTLQPEPRRAGRRALRVGQAAVQLGVLGQRPARVRRGVSVNGGVFRRWFGNFLVTDNTQPPATDFTPFSIPPSSDSGGAGIGGRRRRCRATSTRPGSST